MWAQVAQQIQNGAQQAMEEKKAKIRDKVAVQYDEARHARGICVREAYMDTHEAYEVFSCDEGGHSSLVLADLSYTLYQQRASQNCVLGRGRSLNQPSSGQSSSSKRRPSAPSS